MRRRMLRVAIVSLLSSSFMTLAAQTPSENTKSLQGLVSNNLILISLSLPENQLLSKPGEPCRVTNQFSVKVAVQNNSDQTIKVRLVDGFYQNRPQLFRDGKLLPYRGNLESDLRQQEANPEFVSLRHFIRVAPVSSENLTNINLKDWYGELKPGSYKLINRYRLEVRGPWTPDSEPLLFEVVPKQ
jgi:hypothetical protein